VTTTFTEPAECAGATALIVVLPTTVAEAFVPPKLTVAPVAKPVPVIVTDVPPATGPDDGETTSGSGAVFDMNTNNRRPTGWTSADAAGLAIFPGLIRYDETFGTAEITHAFRVTVRASNGYVWPASHAAGTNSSALPMGARLRLKASKNISGFTPEVQRLFRAMKRYGLIVADNGSDMYISGTMDARWNNSVLNPAFSALTADDFDVVQLGWREGVAPSAPTNVRILR